MKSIRYTLLINAVLCFGEFVQAQTPTDTPKVKKSSPVPVRPVIPAPGSTTTPQPKPATTTPGVKKSSPVPPPRVSKQRNINNVNTAQPGATPEANPVTTTAAPVDPNKPVSDVMFNISLIAGIPQGQFATNTNDDWGWGLDVSMLFNLAQKRPKSDWQSQPINVYMGGVLQFMRHGGKTDTHSYNDQFSETTIDSKVNNNMWGLGFVTRAEFFSGPVKPFVELVAGVRFFTGSHRVDYKNELYNSSNPEDTRRQSFSNNLATSPVGYYGAGGGLRIGSEKVRVELKVTYFKGSKAEYVDLEKIEFDRTDNSITYTTKKSTTDMVIPQLGVSLIF